ncbi:MAG: DUF1540 domain-containing protein [Ruminococcus sp.]|nr:DUF1540 domain-containing protein [Ruminococcus sp.]MEE0952887.1 DUF1540 domain-containing protein [Ruminococcus sp.]
MKEQTYANHCIVCNVTSCQNHHRDKNYCTLEAIRVGTHEKDPSQPPCTDCQSFTAAHRSGQSAF